MICRSGQEVREALFEEKGYVLPYAKDPRRLFKIGVNFSTKTRHLDAKHC